MIDKNKITDPMTKKLALVKKTQKKLGLNQQAPVHPQELIIMSVHIILYNYCGTQHSKEQF